MITLEEKNVSLNERDWDTHSSFTPLYLSVSPNQKFIAVATDKNFHIILKIGTNIRLKLLAEHTCGEYGKPKLAWDITGKYLYCNSELDHDIYIYSLASEKAIHKLQGHVGSVRDIKVTHGYVISGSFDHSIITWNNNI